MLKKTIVMNLATAVVVISLATPFAAYATDASPSPSTLRQDIQENRKEMQGNRQENRVLAAQNHGDRLQMYCTTLENRFTNIIGRIDTRIAKQKGEGKDTSAAETASAQAKTDLGSAKSLCDQAVAKFDSVPKDTWSVQHPVVLEGRKLAQEARAAFVSTRKDILAAIHALIKNAGKTTASPTPAASPSL